jgi:antitoxin component YwqK of YwqJK toxin-antitoxin module
MTPSSMNKLTLLLLIFLNVLVSVNANEVQDTRVNSISKVDLDEILDAKDLFYKDGFGYKKFTDVPYTGAVTGKESGYFKKGKWEGPYTSYHKSGHLEYKGSYSNAKKEGLWKYFRADGNLISEGNYKDGKKEGLWKLFHLFGTKLQARTNYWLGKKNGPYTSFYGNGILMKEGNYRNGKAEGLWIVYDEDGIGVRSKIIYKGGYILWDCAKKEHPDCILG